MKFSALILAAVLSIMQLNAYNNTDAPDENLNDTQQTESVEQVEQPPVDEIIEASALSNTYYKLTTEKKLSIAYIGGSVTDGYGSSDSSTKSWPALLGNWINVMYPDVALDNVKLSIGGTGSYFSSFRYEREVAPHNPDLLFIEYAINDKYNNVTYDQVVRSSESIVRIANKYNPGIDIIYVLTFDTSTRDSDYEQLMAHRDVANYYGYPCIKLADKFYPMLTETNQKYTEFLKDSVHPNDRGYEFFASEIITLIKDELDIAEKAGVAKYTEHKLPKQTLSPTLTLDARMLYADEIDLSNSTGWKHQPYNNYSWLGKRYNGRIYTNQLGAKFTFEFTGTDLGLATGVGPNMGIVSVTVDNNIPVVIDEYSRSTNPKDRIIAQDLPYGKHTVTVEIISKNSSSGGYEFEIGAILIG